MTGWHHFPGNTDIHHIDGPFIDESADVVSALGVKGVGEIGMIGVAAATSNAIGHATAKPIRDLPIELGKVVG